MADKIKEIQTKIIKQLRNGGEQTIAASAYIPIIGWVYPYFFHKDKPLCSFHAKQALQLNIVTVTIYFTIWIIEHFPLTAIFFGPGAILSPFSQTLWLVFLFAYLGFSIMCAYRAFCNESWEIPYLKPCVDKAISYIKSLKGG